MHLGLACPGGWTPLSMKVTEKLCSSFLGPEAIENGTEGLTHYILCSPSEAYLVAEGIELPVH